MAKEARWWKKGEDKFAICNLCRRRCMIAPGRRGYCGIRENRDGKLYAIAYGKAVSYMIDPIEKKPFFHFMPGTQVFSFATVGCNFRCLHCQNWDISQQKLDIIGDDLSPEEIVRLSKGRADGIAYTYTEPTVFMEYALDTAKLAKKEGLYNVFVTNGYMTPEAIKSMGDIDAARVDLKAFDQKFYDRVCGGVDMEGVLDSIKKLHKKMHIEIINLLIPGENDMPEQIMQLAEWVAKLDKSVPLHFTSFYPAYRMMDKQRTPISTLLRAREIAMEAGMKYVYTGNIRNKETESTYCYKCRAMLIERSGFDVERIMLEGDRCPHCGAKQNIVVKVG
ncbi:MAG: AmmeMemoRadiSam system radical SAM enzyme [Candidatus Anstonellales archaeon]